MDYEIKQSKDVNKNFLEQILQLDLEVYPKELNGTMASLQERYNSNNQEYLLLYKKNVLIGYLCFFPITQELSEHIYNNDILYDDNIKAKDICTYSKETPTDVYILSFAITPKEQDGEAVKLLTNTFMTYIKNKLKNEFLIRNIVTTADTEAGIKLLKNLNFNIVKKVQNKYTVMDCKSTDLHSIHFQKKYKDDTFIMIPFTGIGNIREEARNESISEDYIKELEDFADYECHNDLVKNLKRTYLGKKEIGLIDDYYTREVLEKDNAYLFLTSHIDTNLHILTIVLPNNKLSTTMIQDQAVSKNLFIYDNNQLVDITEYIEKKYKIKKCGEVKSIVCLSEKPTSPYEMRAILAAEAYEGEYNVNLGTPYIDSNELKLIEKNNISPYISSEIYASDVAVVYIMEDFSTNFKKNLEHESLTLFIVELIMFQNSAINRTNLKIIETLSKNGNVSLKLLESLYKEFAKTTIFWNNENFYYQTSQNLANCINESFKTDKNFETYLKNQNFLENIVSLKNAQSSNRENIILNALAILFAGLQVVPLLINFIKWLMSDLKNFNYVAITGLSSTTTLIIIILIKKRKKRSCKKTLYS